MIIGILLKSYILPIFTPIDNQLAQSQTLVQRKTGWSTSSSLPYKVEYTVNGILPLQKEILIVKCLPTFRLLKNGTHQLVNLHPMCTFSDLDCIGRQQSQGNYVDRNGFLISS